METLIQVVGPWLIPALFGTCFAGLGYVLLHALQEGARSYAEVYTVEAARQFEDMFLFIPPKRILDIARIAAVTAFILAFLLAGDLTSEAGLAIGAGVGLVAALAALNAPRAILQILRQRRLQRFNEQLVEALTGMSNALRAGFSILQAFETIVKQAQNPIAQEFGMLLQQTRVGVRFEDAMERLEARVGSEDLTLMLGAIESARRTGGNLTEVFDKIAVTIRERMRIQGRIRALTAMGRLQGIIVGAMPALLLLALSLLEPRMVLGFVSSWVGVLLLLLVVALEIAGGLVIRRIIRINI